MKNNITILCLFVSTILMAQKELPYYEIPEAPETYTPGTIASRMVDGLGFRYFWATEGLRPEDLQYKVNDSGRSNEETIEHILGLSRFILNSISDTPEKSKEVKLSFEEKRALTLRNFKKASDILKDTNDISKYDNDRFPFWNIINGPISDALWHCGQIVMMRRASGNPFNSKVSVFTGKVKG